MDNRFFLRLGALAMAGCLCGTSLPSAMASAMPVERVPFPHLAPPSGAGMVTDAFRANLEEAPQIVFIQDTPGDLWAQKNIAQILYTLLPKLGAINTAPIQILVQNEPMPVDTTPFSHIQEPQLQEMTANYLLNKGQLNGVEYFGLLHPDLSGLYALRTVNDLAASPSSWESLIRTAPQHELFLQRLIRTDVALGRLRQQVYSQKLQTLYRLRQAHVNGRLAPRHYAAALWTIARGEHLDITRYAEIRHCAMGQSVSEDADHQDLREADFLSLHQTLAKLLSKEPLLPGLWDRESPRSKLLRHQLVIVDEYLDSLKRLSAGVAGPHEALYINNSLPVLLETLSTIDGPEVANPLLGTLVHASLDLSPLAELVIHNPLLTFAPGEESRARIILADASQIKGMTQILRKKGIAYMTLQPQPPVLSDEEPAMVEKEPQDTLSPEDVARDFANFQSNPTPQMALRPRYLQQ